MAVEVATLPPLVRKITDAPFFTLELVKHLIDEGFILGQNKFTKRITADSINNEDGKTRVIQICFIIESVRIMLWQEMMSLPGEALYKKVKAVFQIGDNFGEAYGKAVAKLDEWKYVIASE